MSIRNWELASFLKSRRRRLTPEQVGLPQTARRRHACLRREEVAWVADIGITWYTWLEQGRPIKVAAETLKRVASALRLDFSETEYLEKLVQTASKGRHHWDVRIADRICGLVKNYSAGHAFVITPRWDLLVWNHPVAKLFNLKESAVGLQRNGLWILFTDERARRLFPNWIATAREMASMFRVEYADYVGDSDFEELIRALCSKSPEFAAIWSGGDVLSPTRWRLGQIRDLKSGNIVAFETVSLPLPESPGQTLILSFPMPA